MLGEGFADVTAGPERLDALFLHLLDDGQDVAGD